MDEKTIAALGDVVSKIGLPSTIGLILLIAAWNLLPILAEYLRSKIEVNSANARAIDHSINPPSMQSGDQSNIRK